MVDRKILSDRLNETYKLLLSRGKVHSKTDLARAVGVAHSVISAALSNKGRVMTLGLLKRVAEAFPDILNADYLLTGEGALERLDPSDCKPFVPTPACAGVPSADDAGVGRAPVLSLSRAVPRYDFSLLVHGDSMEPDVCDGDLALCRRMSRDTPIDHDRLYVIEAHGQAVIKRICEDSYAGLTARSSNPRYPDLRLPATEIHGISEVVAILRAYRPLNLPAL